MELEARMASIHNLAFLGPKRAAEVTQLLIQSKLLVNTSTFEGFPNTMLEAWSVGVPVVSLNVDPGHVIQREQIGRVSGTFENLCRDVEQIAHTSELNCAMGEQGLAYVRQQHSLEAVFRAFTAILPGLHAVPDGMQKELGSV
jgi:glycosyltransferase involved in cell wall biosynthesis